MHTTTCHDPRMDQDHHWGGIDSRAAVWVFNDLVAYLSRPIDQIAQEYWRYCDSEGLTEQERVAHAANEGAVMAYYQVTPHYLYELSYWESSQDKQAWLKVLARACRARGIRRILDYGGGIGGACLSLRRAGLECDYLDVAGKTFNYAAWRFARHGISPRMSNILEGWPAEHYDAVVTWDVLEHVFDLEDTITHISHLIRPGGWLINKSTFADTDGHHEHIHLAKHACYQDIRAFNDLIVSRGFRFLGQLKPNRLSRLLRSCGLRYAVAGARITPRLKHGGNFLVHERTA